MAAYQDDIVAKLAGQREIETGVTLSDRSTPTRRTVALNYLVAELTALGLTVQQHDYGSGTNPWVRIESTEGGSEVVVVGAHYDSVPQSPGANDNATGTAAVLTAARYVSQLECRSRSFVFVLFDEEEIGLVGSQAFAALLVNQGTNVHSVHTMDQMGWDNDGDRAIELERASAGLFDLYNAARIEHGLTFQLLATTTGQTDHVSFRDRGFPAIGLTEEFVNSDTTPHYHLSTDTYATVDFGYLASTSELLNAVLANLADPAN
jgi:Zn-dependent M28 family amino/carboxypeptidase